MASKAKTLQVKDKEKDDKAADAPEKDSTDAPSPLLDLSDAAVKKMIKQAKKRGFVTFDQLNEVLPSDTTSPEQIEDIMSMLSDMGINVSEAEDSDSEEENKEEAEDETDNELVEVTQKAVTEVKKSEPGERTDDPVRMYLREMGTVELLSREGEIAIAKRIEAGQEAMIAGLCESPLTFQASIIWRDELNEGKIFLRDIIDLEATYAGPDAKNNMNPAMLAAPVGPDGQPLAVGSNRGGQHRRVHVVLGVGAGVGGFEIDDVAKEDFSFVQLVAPDDDGLEGQRAFAQACDHRLAAGLDALGNGDFAFARQQLDGAHLAQIHPDGIVGALAGLGLLDFGDGLLRDLDQLVVGLVVGLFLAVFLAVGILGLGDVDAHLGEHRHDVLDLLRRGGVGRQHFIELIEGHEAALLGLLDHLLDGGIGQIEQRRRRVRRILLGRVGCLVVFFFILDLQRLCLGGHSLAPEPRFVQRRVAAPATTIQSSRMTHKGRRITSPPPNCI